MTLNKKFKVTFAGRLTLQYSTVAGRLLRFLYGTSYPVTVPVKV